MSTNKIINDMIQYCQLEIKKAKAEYKAGRLTISELQRSTRAINNIISFAIMQRTNDKEV